MGRLWCRDLPVVTVPPAKDTKRLTLIVPYYCNPQFFQRQVAHWRSLWGVLKFSLSIIVVDDGSPEPLHHPGPMPMPFKAFRIEQDIRWNWLAARNIGAHHAEDGWLLLTDIDHLVPESTLIAVLMGDHDPRTVYAFSRQEHTGETIAPHSASFLMTREMFWRIGGYDEALSGHYGTDGEYRRRVAKVAKMAVLSEPLIRHEYVEDSSTTRYQRKQPEDAKVRQLIASRGKHWTPKVLSFPYHEVAA